jgi:hypothetical protein
VSIAYCSADSANTGNHPTAGFRLNSPRLAVRNPLFLQGHEL